MLSAIFRRGARLQPGRTGQNLGPGREIDLEIERFRSRVRAGLQVSKIVCAPRFFAAASAPSTNGVLPLALIPQTTSAPVTPRSSIASAPPPAFVFGPFDAAIKRGHAAGHDALAPAPAKRQTSAESRSHRARPAARWSRRRRKTSGRLCATPSSPFRSPRARAAAAFAQRFLDKFLFVDEKLDQFLRAHLSRFSERGLRCSVSALARLSISVAASRTKQCRAPPFPRPARRRRVRAIARSSPRARQRDSFSVCAETRASRSNRDETNRPAKSPWARANAGASRPLPCIRSRHPRLPR